VGGQRSSAENDVAGQSAATPFRQDGLRKLLHALVYGAVGGYDGWNAGGGSEAGDGVDEMVGQGLHTPVATQRGEVHVVGADRLDDTVQHAQCLFDTGEFIHGVS
jgi:hypothetical protein